MKASWCRNEGQEDLAGRKRVVRERERKNLHSLSPSLCWAQPISSLVFPRNGWSISREKIKTTSFYFQDFDVRLWHIPSRQCVRTLGHKGAVGIVKFFAPVAGIYFFKLTASWGNLGGYLYLRKNYKNIGPFQKDEDTFKTPILKLDAGDEISVYVHVTSTSYYLQGFYGRSESTGISPELFGVLLYEINQEIEHTTYGPLHKEWVPLVNQWIG